MGNRAGVLTFTDLSQVQKTRENSELETFLSEMSVNRPSDLVSKISVIFQNGSAKRSHFFMDFKYREYASMRMGANYQMPVFGVKGETPKISRKANYVELLFASEADLAGAKFNEVLFGTNYLTGEETVEMTDNELVASLSGSGGAPGCTVARESAETVVRIVEKLWEASEKDPRTRFVIELDRAGSCSMSLLQQIFLLIPQRLRLQMGYMTNIAAQDLTQIQNETVPIYIMTADSREEIDPGKYSFPVVIFRIRDAMKYTYNEHHLALLRKLASSVSDKFISVLDNAEKEYLDQKDEVSSSFKYYGEIVSGLFTGGDFWWKRGGFNTVSELRGAYEAQSELMKQEDFRREAFADFYMNIYPNSNLAADTISVLTSPESDERNGLLSFLMTKLGQGKLIGAIADFGNRTATAERNAAEARQKEMASGYEARLAAAAKEKEAVSGELQTLESKYTALEDQNAALRSENERAAAEIARFRSASQEADEEGSGRKAGSKEERTIERAKKKIAALQKQRLIFMIATGVMAALAILFLVLFLTKKPEPAAVPAQEESVQTSAPAALPETESEETEENGTKAPEVKAESNSSLPEAPKAESVTLTPVTPSAVETPGASEEPDAESSPAVSPAAESFSEPSAQTPASDGTESAPAASSESSSPAFSGQTQPDESGAESSDGEGK